MAKPDDTTARAFLFDVAMSPIAWLLVLQLCLVWALYLVGYLSLQEVDTIPEAVLTQKLGGAQYRSGLAYSGVTLGITFALAITSLAWAVSAFLRKGPSFVGEPSRARRWKILATVVVLTSLFSIALLALRLEPFPSKLGLALLEWVYGQPADKKGWLARQVPWIMFALSIIVPAMLAAGASFLQEPINDAVPAERNRKVLLRVRELDQLLYIGALALVFGTLQLSATMSVPLANMPKAADLKNQLELCKFLVAAPADGPLRGKANDPKCVELPELMAREEESISGLRQLVRAVNLALGLSFSAMLVAIYVPAMVSLRLMLSPVTKESAAQDVGSKKDGEASAVDVDPLRRIAAVAATLGPLIAGLVANAFGSG